MDEVDAASASRGAPALAADVVAALVDRVDDHNEILRQLGLLAVNESVRKLAFHQIAERVQRTCSDRETVSNGLRRWRGGLSEGDLLQANYRIAMDRSEHFQMMLTQFPTWVDQIDYWDVSDIPFRSSTEALPEIELKVMQLLDTFSR